VLGRNNLFRIILSKSFTINALINAFMEIKALDDALVESPLFNVSNANLVSTKFSIPIIIILILLNNTLY
jgi:hypothetical protein